MQHPNDESATATEERKPFWRRQFQPEATRNQKIFDWIFGVILPTVCAAADPLVFRGAGMGKGPLLGSAKAFAFVLSFVSIMAMVGWLLAGQRLKYFSSAFAGLFSVGAFISFCVGLLILPFSLLGLFFYLIGLLGFVPLLAGFVFLRNGWRAIEGAKLLLQEKLLASSLALSAAASFAIPFVINGEINRYLDEMVSADPQTIRAHGQRLRYVAPLVNADHLGGQYCASPNSDEHMALADVYLQLTGETIERIDFHICNDW